MVELSSTITCPKCSAKSLEQMPMNACKRVYECRGCGAVLTPLDGDCCVFCSYGALPCPPVQDGQPCCS